MGRLEDALQRTSFLPGSLFRTRNALENIAELVPSRNGRELTDLLRVHRVVAHAFDDRNDDPGFGDQLHHGVIQGRSLRRVSLVEQLLVAVDKLLAEPLAILFVPEQALRAVR